MIHDDEPETRGSPDVPEPPGPDTMELSGNRTLNAPVNEVETRLPKQRKVLIFGVANEVARGVAARLWTLASDGNDPIGSESGGCSAADVTRNDAPALPTDPSHNPGPHDTPQVGSLADELRFIAEWQRGNLPFLGSIVRVRQVYRANPQAFEAAGTVRGDRKPALS